MVAAFSFGNRCKICSCHLFSSQEQQRKTRGCNCPQWCLGPGAARPASGALSTCLTLCICCRCFKCVVFFPPLFHMSCCLQPLWSESPIICFSWLSDMEQASNQSRSWYSLNIDMPLFCVLCLMSGLLSLRDLVLGLVLPDSNVICIGCSHCLHVFFCFVSTTRSAAFTQSDLHLQPEAFVWIFATMTKKCTRSCSPLPHGY